MEYEWGIEGPSYDFVYDYPLRRDLVPLLTGILENNRGIWEIELLRKRPEIEKIKVKTKDGKKVSAGEVAEENWQLMAKETTQAWSWFLNNFFNEQQLPEPLRIFDLSPYGGLETEGIIRWATSRGIKGGLDVFDLMASWENWREDLNKLAADLPGKEYDLVILRDPGPVVGDENRELWEKVFEAVAKTNPQHLLVTSGDSVIWDYGMGMKEMELFTQWLKQRGYNLKDSITSYSLKYPTFIYGLTNEDWCLRIMDRVKVLYEKTSPFT